MNTTGTPDSEQGFINREVSWLAFNERVLQEAADPKVPLVERLRFLGIFSNNLDEFFRVRVASLNRLCLLAKKERPAQEKSPEQTLERIKKIVLEGQRAFGEYYSEILAQLEEHDIKVVNETELSSNQQRFVRDYFYDHVRPNLVPIMLGNRDDFPELKDSHFYFLIHLKFKGGDENYALMEIPSELPRFVILPEHQNKKCLIYLDDIIRFKLNRVFSIFDLDEVVAYTLKTSRDAELDMDDDIQQSIIQKMSLSVKRRRQGNYVRLLYDQAMPEAVLDVALAKLGFSKNENVIPGSKYHNKRDLMRFPDFGQKNLVYRKQPPLPHESLINSSSVINQIDDKGILIHTPYHDFGYIVDLLREAAIDPTVTTIRITLYRVMRESLIMNALVNAAKNGKKVQVVIELQARFDESNNIDWSNALQEAGARVIFGVPGLKVHSKLILITRKSRDKTQRIACVGTGNFHEGNAKVYTDIFYLTSEKGLTKEVRKVFEFFKNNYARGVFKRLVISPFNTRRRLTKLIGDEIKNAGAGKPAWIKLKLNNLVDPVMINRLYQASKSGVKISILVRGICALVPGVKGQSENITVTSVVGRYLEHSRIMIFANGGEPLYFISSADWMTRNLDHRVEVGCPIHDEEHQRELDHIMSLHLGDNVKARVIDGNLENRYVSAKKHKQAIDSQSAIYEHFKDKIV